MLNRVSGNVMLTVTELSFVNREEELALLKSLFDNAMAGKVQVVFLAGEVSVRPD